MVNSIGALIANYYRHCFCLLYHIKLVCMYCCISVVLSSVNVYSCPHTIDRRAKSPVNLSAAMVSGPCLHAVSAYFLIKLSMINSD